MSSQGFRRAGSRIPASSHHVHQTGGASFRHEAAVPGCVLCSARWAVVAAGARLASLSPHTGQRMPFTVHPTGELEVIVGEDFATFATCEA